MSSLSVPVENAASGQAVEQSQTWFVIRLGRSVVFFLAMNLALLRFVTREVEGWMAAHTWNGDFLSYLS